MKLNQLNGQIPQPDPYVICVDNVYYMYVTGYEGVKTFKSANFIDWEYIGVCYQKDGEKEYWAPCIYQDNDLFYMYVSSMPIDSDDVHLQRIQVAVSSTPLGPFTFISFLTEPFSIDPHVVKSGNDLFMFYSINDYEAIRAGTLIVVDKMESPTKLCKKPKEVVRPTLDEEIFMRDRFKKGQHWHTLEGAFYFYEDGCHYLMYSGNCYQNENYYIGYATSQEKELDLTKITFHKYPDENTYHPLIKKNEQEEGTGHNSVIKVKDEYLVVYHGRDYLLENTQKECRTARFLSINVKNGVLTIKER